uniref:AlNc14C306G10442 protein n=1 Tax=Albugo laibachii Nc14 TaxID=890382 RepID=F0WVY1_9STRA|nr:AlNc14C306G10442 [Albugo laibachii Nc14]|eukprot:CCA25582.1 AlNc14C306G10442 [Albugo laibachii Nc14]
MTPGPDQQKKTLECAWAGHLAVIDHKLADDLVTTYAASALVAHHTRHIPLRKNSIVMGPIGSDITGTKSARSHKATRIDNWETLL